MNKRVIMLSGVMASVLLAPAFALSQGFGNLISLAKQFQDLLGVLTTVVIALALIFFLWGLAVFILSAGDEEKRKEGKKIMVWGAIAFTVMIGIWGIVTFILKAFGLEEDTPPFIPGV